MYFRTLVITWMNLFIDAVVTAFKTAPSGALMTSPKIHLYTNTYTPTPFDTPATYTEATFSGYAAVALSALSAALNIGINTRGLVQPAQFIASGTVSSQTCYGYYLTDTTGTILYGAERFATPAVINNAGDFIQVTVATPLPLTYAIA